MVRDEATQIDEVKQRLRAGIARSQALIGQYRSRLLMLRDSIDRPSSGERGRA